MKENTPQFGYVYRKKSMINHEIWGYYTILSQNVPHVQSNPCFFRGNHVFKVCLRPRVPKVCPVSPAVAMVSAMTLAPATVTAARIQDGQIPRYQTCYRHIPAGNLT